MSRKKLERNSSIEVLRIIAMLFIVLSHCCIHSEFNCESWAMGINALFVQWGRLGNLGVDIFVLISGYFWSQKEVKYQTLLKLFAQVWFYSVVLFIVCKLVFHYQWTSWIEIARAFFPILFGEYWFFNAYIVLLLLTPLLNFIPKNIDYLYYRKLVILLIVLWSIIPTVTIQYQNMYGDTLAQFVLLYLIGGYLRLYPSKILECRRKRELLTIISFGILFISTFMWQMIGEKSKLLENRVGFLYERNSIVVIGCAIGLFAIAIYSKPFYSKFINTIGVCTFGVYLIHDNPIVRKVLWLQLFRNRDYSMSNTLIPRIIASVFIVYSISTLIEYARIRFVEKRVLAVIEKLGESVKTVLSEVIK